MRTPTKVAFITGAMLVLLPPATAFAAEPRVAWTASKIVGSPDPPPPYKTVNAFPNIKLDKPTFLVALPRSDRLFAGQEQGKVFSFVNKTDAKAELCFDVAKDVKTLDLTPDAMAARSVYSLAFHPRFAENRYAYLCYILDGKNGGLNFKDGSRISRFKLTDTNPPRLDADSEVIVFSWPAGGHNGCDLHFGPDGFLYLSTGDASDPNPPDPNHTGQDCSDYFSSVLRIDVDRKDTGKNYAVPKDNPFVGMPNVKPEIWAFGFRNPWRFSFDKATGELWLGDVGWELWEMVHKVEKGKNYGWSITEARQPIHPNDKPGPNPIITPPVIEIPHTAGASVTGGYVYRGKKFPELVGAYVFGDWETRKIWAAHFENGKVISWPEIVPATVRPSAFGQDNDGEVYAVDYDTGVIHGLARNDTASTASTFPRKLSETGLFTNTKEQTPAPGVYRFTPNVALWQDHAVGEHFVALPGNSAVSDFEAGKPIPGNVFWHSFRYHFPENAVLAKTISIEMERGKPQSKNRLETQVLHFADGFWQGYTYAWRDDQTDADLVPTDGGEKLLNVADASFPGRKRQQMWTYHSRSQCLQCHNAWSEYSLAFNAAQLNFGDQLTMLGELGLLNRFGANDKPKGVYTPDELKQELRLTPPHGATATVEERATSYLHVNCAHCHRNGGGGTTSIDLSAFEKRRIMKDLEVAPRLGGFDLIDAKVVTAQQPTQSVLYYRMSKFGKGRMPHIGSELPDEQGLKLIHDWIAGPNSARVTSDMKWEQLCECLKTPGAALGVARFVGRNELAAEMREKLLKEVAASPKFTVRDLFDGYLPHTGERKLGPIPRPQTILVKTGDAERGRQLFFNQRLLCTNCHKLDGKGTELGPDLALIGKQRTRTQILESLLEPSRTIDAKFQQFLLNTLDGRSFAGLLVKRDAKEVVLKDTQNKEVRVASLDIEALMPGRESIMPTGALADLTAQEAADLLAFLLSRK